MHRKLNEFLVGESEAGRRVVVVIDEAQNLRQTVLEALRMLSNFETPQGKVAAHHIGGSTEIGRTIVFSSYDAVAATHLNRGQARAI